MGQLRALWETRGARRIEDAGVIIWINVYVGHGTAASNHLFIRHNSGREVVAAHAHKRDALGHIRPLHHPGQTFGIAEQHLGARILQAIFQLIGDPPRIHADASHTNRDTSPIEQHPFGIVAHGHSNPVTPPHALAPKPSGNGIHLLMRLAIGDTLILVHQIIPVAKGHSREPDGADIGRGVLVTADIAATHVNLFDLERLPR